MVLAKLIFQPGAVVKLTRTGVELIIAKRIKSGQSNDGQSWFGETVSNNCLDSLRKLTEAEVNELGLTEPVAIRILA